MRREKWRRVVRTSEGERKRGSGSSNESNHGLCFLPLVFFCMRIRAILYRCNILSITFPHGPANFSPLQPISNLVLLSLRPTTSVLLASLMGSCVSSTAHTTTVDTAPRQESSKNEFAMSNGATSPFVQARNGSLWLGDQPYRFASLNSPELLDGDVNQGFEVDDTMQSIAMGFGRPVTRTYTLRIKSVSSSGRFRSISISRLHVDLYAVYFRCWNRSGRVGRGHINGWNVSWGDWEWDEGRLIEFDYVLDSARRNGVKLIIPIINQDTGDESTNWVGNTRNLIAMKKGISLEQAKGVDWWTDGEMIERYAG